MSSALYVLSATPEATDQFKVGFHTGDIKKLRKRYITSHPQHKIHYFIEMPFAKQVEKQFKKEYFPCRVTNNGENASEWFRMPLNEIIDGLSAIITCPDKTKPLVERFIKKYYESDHQSHVLSLDFDRYCCTYADNADGITIEKLHVRALMGEKYTIVKKNGKWCYLGLKCAGDHPSVYLS